MTKNFPRLIFYIFVYGCCFSTTALTSLAEPQPQTQLNKNTTKQTVLNNYEEPKNKNNDQHKANQPANRTANKTITKRLVLVPPPPPDAPSLLNWPGLTGFAGFSEPISFLGQSDLKARLQHLDKQIDNAQLRLKENDTHLAESAERANQFNSLFTEGVVSRKELEAAQREVIDIKQQNEEAKGHLADLKMEENAIIKRLNALKQKEPRKRK